MNERSATIHADRASQTCCSAVRSLTHDVAAQAASIPRAGRSGIASKRAFRNKRV